MKKRIIIALDFSDEDNLYYLVDRLDPMFCYLKIGKELFTKLGFTVIKKLQIRGFDIFLDLKFYDIPNTVLRACIQAADLNVWMINVHASGGIKMMEGARQVLDVYGKDRPLLTAVTILTSIDINDLNRLGFSDPIILVPKLAKMAYNSGFDGVISSAKEVLEIKSICNPNFITVTPGIRLKNMHANDQKRTLTPIDAIKNFVDYIVIGRLITHHINPMEQLTIINNELIGF